MTRLWSDTSRSGAASELHVHASPDSSNPTINASIPGQTVQLVPRRHVLLEHRSSNSNEVNCLVPSIPSR